MSPPAAPAAAKSLRLFSYFRSSASYRVRCALNYKAIPYEIVPVNLLNGEQFDSTYQNKNSSNLLPTLQVSGPDGAELTLTQSLAILEWLEEAPEVRNDAAPLLPSLRDDAVGRQKVRALASIVAADTQPIQNLRVLKKVKTDYGGEAGDWAGHWIRLGFGALEAEVAKVGSGVLAVC